jgi:hypothetical protein
MDIDRFPVIEYASSALTGKKEMRRSGLSRCAIPCAPESNSRRTAWIEQGRGDRPANVAIDLGPVVLVTSAVKARLYRALTPHA